MGYIDSHGNYIPNPYLERRHHSNRHSNRHSDMLFLPDHLLVIFIGILLFLITILIITYSK